MSDGRCRRTMLGMFLGIVLAGPTVAEESRSEFDCQMDHIRIASSQSFLVNFCFIPEAIELNKASRIFAIIKPSKEAESLEVDLSFDARMPLHAHGTVTTPGVRPVGDGFLVEGVVFHMPGNWELYFDIHFENKQERASYALEVF